MGGTIRTLAVAWVVLAVCFAAGCVGTAPPAKLGEPVSSGPWELTVNKVDSVASYEGKAASSGNVWLVAKGTVKNTGSAAGTLDPAWFGAGKNYDTYTGAVTIDGKSSAQEVATGSTVTIVAAFEVPASATEIALLFETPNGAAQVLLN